MFMDSMAFTIEIPVVAVFASLFAWYKCGLPWIPQTCGPGSQGTFLLGEPNYKAV